MPIIYGYSLNMDDDGNEILSLLDYKFEVSEEEKHRWTMEFVEILLMWTDARRASRLAKGLPLPSD